MDVGSNQEWCAQLYESRGAGLLLYARSLGLSHSEAEDVLQDTFRALLQRKHPPVQTEAYVFRAVRNRALNYRRSLMRRIARELESQRWFEPAPDPTDREEQAMQLLATLPREQREVIVLKIWNSHTFELMGELLGLSANTVASRYRYGLQKLRAALEREEEEQYERHGLERHRGAPQAMGPKNPVCPPFQEGLPSPTGG